MNAGPHLDDDRLSALIDGDATPDDLAHAATCSECNRLVAAWREASQLVSIPSDPPPAAQRQAAVEAALKDGAAQPPAPDDDPHAGPVSLAARRDRVRPRAPRALIGPRIAAAAAAVIVIAGVAVAVSHSGGGSTKSSTASRSTASASTASGSIAGRSTAGGQFAAPVSATTLALPSTTSSAASQGSATAAGPLARFEVLAGNQSPASLVASLQAAMTPTPSTTKSAAQPSPSQVALAPCLNRAAADVGVKADSVPALAASLTYQGAAAQVFVFAVGAGHVAAVVAGPACALLTHVAF